MIQSQDQSEPIKFEVHMYYPTAMANAVTPAICFYTLYVHTPSSIVQRDNPSRLEIAFVFRQWCFNLCLKLPNIYYSYKTPRYQTKSYF